MGTHTVTLGSGTVNVTVSAVSGGGTTRPLTTKGDIWTYSTLDARLPVGTNGFVLKADSSEATGLKWEAQAGGGDMSASTYDPATVSEQLVGLTATQTLTNKTLTTPTITLNQGAAPTPTAEGDIQWDTDDNTIKIGDGASTKVFSDDSVNASTYAPIADPTFTGEIGIGAVNVSEIELGILEGATLNTTELNYVDGVTSAIQTQLDAKTDESTLTTKGDLYVATSASTITRIGAGTNDYVLTADSAEATGLKWAASASGFADPMTTRGDVIIRDSTNTTARLGVGTNGQVLTTDGTDISWGTVAGSGDVSKVGTPVDNQVGVWTGDGTIEGTTGLTYDGANFQLTGDIGATGSRITKGWFTDLQVTNSIAGSITGNAATVTTITGLAPDTATTAAAQPNITSLGTLTEVQVDNININGNTISSTAGTDLLLTPLAGQQLVLDGTIVVDAGVVTGATSITSTAFVGALTGNADTVTGYTPASGSLTLSGADALTLTTTATTNVILPTTGTLMANVVEDTTPQLGADVDYNSNGFKLVSQTVGGLNGDLVYLSGSTTWSQADASAEATAKGAMAIRISATEVLVHGVYTTTGLTAGRLYYMSETAGAITTIAPSTSLSIVRPVAYALSTTELYIFPSGSYVENA